MKKFPKCEVNSKTAHLKTCPVCGCRVGWDIDVNALTDAENKGKLAGKKELYEKWQEAPMHTKRGHYESWHEVSLWLKSQIKDSEESHSSRPFAPKRKLEAKK